jgi:hypothetical protein
LRAKFRIRPGARAGKRSALNAEAPRRGGGCVGCCGCASTAALCPSANAHKGSWESSSPTMPSATGLPPATAAARGAAASSAAPVAEPPHSSSDEAAAGSWLGARSSRPSTLSGRSSPGASSARRDCLRPGPCVGLPPPCCTGSPAAAAACSPVPAAGMSQGAVILARFRWLLRTCRLERDPLALRRGPPPASRDWLERDPSPRRGRVKLAPEPMSASSKASSFTRWCWPGPAPSPASPAGQRADALLEPGFALPRLPWLPAAASAARWPELELACVRQHHQQQ